MLILIKKTQIIKSNSQFKIFKVEIIILIKLIMLKDFIYNN